MGVVLAEIGQLVIDLIPMAPAQPGGEGPRRGGDRRGRTGLGQIQRRRQVAADRLVLGLDGNPRAAQAVERREQNLEIGRQIRFGIASRPVGAAHRGQKRPEPVLCEHCVPLLSRSPQAAAIRSIAVP
jgi:hypothetical protein